MIDRTRNIMNVYHFQTKNNKYIVDNVEFLIGTIKITCTGSIYIVDTMNTINSKIELAYGFGFNCSEALMTMIESIPKILSEYENNHVNNEDESYDKPNQDLRYENIV
jgi:hypothetical protein